MRKSEENRHKNKDATRELALELSKLSNLLPNQFEYILEILYLGIIHKIACISRDADEYPTEIQIEIPHFGQMILKVSHNTVVLSDFLLEDEFKVDINNAITKGESPLQAKISDSFVKRIQKRYKELL